MPVMPAPMTAMESVLDADKGALPPACGGIKAPSVIGLRASSGPGTGFRLTPSARAAALLFRVLDEMRSLVPESFRGGCSFGAAAARGPWRTLPRAGHA